MKRWYAAFAIFAVVVAIALWLMRGTIAGVVPLLGAPLAVQEGEPLPFLLPEGFAAIVYADDVPGVRVLTRDPLGTLVATLTSEGRVVALPDENADGKADSVVPILEGLNGPHGVVFFCEPEHPERCTLYIAESNVVKAYRYDAVSRKATAPKTLTALPSGSGHSTRSLLLHPDGQRLLIAVGSSCNVCHEKDTRRASVIAVDLAENAVTPYATGLRNTVFMALNPVNEDIWGTDMGRDLLGDDLPPDEVNIIREGKNYGWPTCYGKNIHDTNFDKNTYIRNPCMEPFEMPSHIDIPAHSAPLGIAFVPEEGWPKEYGNDVFVAYHGSWNRSIPTGYKIVRFDIDTEGRPKGAGEDFMTGFIADGKVLGRPVGLLAEPGGILYVSDDRAGAIYKVFRGGH